MKSTKITGVWTRSSSIHEKEIARKTIKWCIKYFGLEWHNINIHVKIKQQKDCWGTCEEGNKDRSYIITVDSGQSIRDFVATIIHEMVHVKQYATGKWKGTGEREAEKLQYKLTDKLWKEDIL